MVTFSDHEPSPAALGPGADCAASGVQGKSSRPINKIEIERVAI
jgi:hypothetical protein